MKIEVTTQFVLAPLNTPAADGSGLEYEVIRDVAQVGYNRRGLPNIVTDTHRTRCANLGHGLTEWWAQINRFQRVNENVQVIDISPDYSVTLFYTEER